MEEILGKARVNQHLEILSSFCKHVLRRVVDPIVVELEALLALVHGKAELTLGVSDWD